jgi:hypothetical protein
MSKADTPAEKGGYSGRIPAAAINVFEWELTGLVHGMASLVIHIRDGKLARFVTGRERSHMAEGGNDE